ncbi:MAG: Rieske 2Fe-2S domain-containing protein [Gemmatimonadota bacterium]|nr:Rieske 2Fe-2S domain-containing protein [Gemmatimonadota bacterium]
MCASPSVPFISESPEFERVALVSELAEGRISQRILATGAAVCLVRHNGEISALSDICTHQHFSMSQGDLLHDGTIQCAWHGARFDCRTGEVKQIPASSPLPVYEVRLDGEHVLVGPRRNRDGDRYEPSVASIGDLS